MLRSVSGDRLLFLTAAHVAPSGTLSLAVTLQDVPLETATVATHSTLSCPIAATPAFLGDLDEPAARAATIFRARAIAARGVPWLAKGFHFRVKVNPWIGFPLHPFAAWRLHRLGEEIPPPIVWRDRAGKTVSMPVDIQEAGGEVYGTVTSTNAANPWVWIEFIVDDGGMRIDLLDSKLVERGTGSSPAGRESRSPSGTESSSTSG